MAVNVVCYWPQIWKIVSRKRADDVSAGTYALFLLNSSLMALHGWVAGDVTVVAVGASSVAQNLLVLWLCRQYGGPTRVASAPSTEPEGALEAHQRCTLPVLTAEEKCPR